MKRIITNTTDDESTKPVFGSKGNPPFYDPNDLHVHVWKKGKLAVEENPKIPTYSNSKLSIRSCVYCKICHTIKDSFQSCISDNKDIVEDIITVKSAQKGESYKLINPGAAPSTDIMIRNIDRDETELGRVAEQDDIPTCLFHKQEGIFDDYVVVE
jgi:hypothetical protein